MQEHKEFFEEFLSEDDIRISLLENEKIREIFSLIGADNKVINEYQAINLISKIEDFDFHLIDSLFSEFTTNLSIGINRNEMEKEDYDLFIILAIREFYGHSTTKTLKKIMKAFMKLKEDRKNALYLVAELFHEAIIKNQKEDFIKKVKKAINE